MQKYTCPLQRFILLAQVVIFNEYLGPHCTTKIYENWTTNSDVGTDYGCEDANKILIQAERIPKRSGIQ
jgi:hypothetical protein